MAKIIVPLAHCVLGGLWCLCDAYYNYRQRLYSKTVPHYVQIYIAYIYLEPCFLATLLLSLLPSAPVGSHAATPEGSVVEAIYPITFQIS